jgi:hypothetical protein
MLEKILEVFSKEYKEETKYLEFLEKNKNIFKLNDDSEDINLKIKRLSDKELKSDFKIKYN